MTENNEKVEQEARGMGWVPQDEFRGDPEKWRPANEFLDRGKNMLPILQERMGKLQGDMEGYKTTISGLETTISDNAQKTQAAILSIGKKAYDRGRNEIIEGMKKAGEDGDTDKVESLGEDLKALDKAAEVPDVTSAPPQGNNPHFDQWIAKPENGWYYSDRVARDVANSIAVEMANQGQNPNTLKFYEDVTARVQSELPERFVKGKKLVPGSDELNVERGGADPPPPKGNKKSFKNLPQWAKDGFDELADQTLPDGKPLITKEDYVKSFDWSAKDMEA